MSGQPFLPFDGATLDDLRVIHRRRLRRESITKTAPKRSRRAGKDKPDELVCPVCGCKAVRVDRAPGVAPIFQCSSGYKCNGDEIARRFGLPVPGGETP